MVGLLLLLLLVAALLLLLVATTTVVAAPTGERADGPPTMDRWTTDTGVGAGEGDFFDRFNGCWWHGSREVVAVALLPMSTFSSMSRGEGVCGGATTTTDEGEAGGAGDVIVEWGDWK